MAAYPSYRRIESMDSCIASAISKQLQDGRLSIGYWHGATKWEKPLAITRISNFAPARLFFVTKISIAARSSETKSPA
jgi:hypothetical protein